MQHSLARLLTMKADGEKIAMLTAYDAIFARLLTDAGIDVLLVGDSLGMIVQGAKDTLAVKLSESIYHLRCVRAGAADAIVVGDMPFATFQSSPERAYINAAKLIAAGATAVKIEGGMTIAPTVEFLTARGIPVCAHIGLMPQWIRAQGRYKVQGRGDDEKRVQADAKIMQESGACMIVLELIPASLAATITAMLTIPTIGIGSGKGCDGQVLVTHDMLGMSTTQKKMVRNFMINHNSIRDAVVDYIQAVKQGIFPSQDNSFE